MLYDAVNLVNAVNWLNTENYQRFVYIHFHELVYGTKLDQYDTFLIIRDLNLSVW